MTKALLAYLGFLPLLTASQVTVEWDPNPESIYWNQNTVGYIVYYGTESGVYDNVVDVPQGVSVTLESLAHGVTYYSVVTAYGHFGVEGNCSEEIQFVAPTSLSDLDHIPVAYSSYGLSFANKIVSFFIDPDGPPVVYVYASCDLRDWEIIDTVTNNQGEVTLFDPLIGQKDKRFYTIGK